MDEDAIFIHLCQFTTEMLEEFEAEDDAALAYMMHRRRRKLTMSIKQPEHRDVRRRRYSEHNRKQQALKLMHDYFDENCVYSDADFTTHFHMQRNLFNRILTELMSVDDFFCQRYDARNMPGHSPHQKLVGALQLLAYGCTSSAAEEYVPMGKSTAYLNLKRFCSSVVQYFGPRYLRTPTAEDARKLLEQNERRGFPGMLGSIGCMHWEWKNCPVAWHGDYVGHCNRPTIILEAVASQDLWFWHAFFGTPGSSSNLDVFEKSNIFDNLLTGRAPPANFIINGNQYEMGYYMADGTYPKLATIVQSFEVADSPQKLKFNEHQEAKRKDIERAFAVLQSRFGIVSGPVMQWDREELDKIMKTCIILHNIIVEDERRDPNWSYVYDSTDKARNQVAQGVDLSQCTTRGAAMRDEDKHFQLRDDLVEHIWAKHQMGEQFED